MLLTAPLVTTIVSAPDAYADADPPPCTSTQVVVGFMAATEAAVSHQAVLLSFELASYAQPCAITGYPGVDTRDGGPRISAERTLRGYLGGLPTGSDALPTVTMKTDKTAYAFIEDDAVDADGNACPTYTSLRVTPPDSTDTQNVSVTITACELQIHPIGSTL